MTVKEVIVSSDTSCFIISFIATRRPGIRGGQDIGRRGSQIMAPTSPNEESERERVG